MYSLSAHGAEAAKLVLRVLAGPEPSGPPMSEVQTNKVLFDWRQMQRWGISEIKPACRAAKSGSVDPTAWDQYRWQILADRRGASAPGRDDHLAALRAPSPA